MTVLTKDDNMHLAFYKGPATDVLHKLSHTAVTWWTISPYSHVELYMDGECYSASARDKGVRKKVIDIDSGKWDLVPVRGNRQLVLDFYEKTKGMPYDWAGIGRYVIPALPNSPNRWYCSEWCATALVWEKFECDPGQAYDYSMFLNQ